MKPILKYLPCILITLSSLNSYPSLAQWKTINAGFTESDLSRITNQSYQAYQGLNGGSFAIQARVEKRKVGNNYHVLLHVNNINLDKYYGYTIRPAQKVKYCMGGQHGGIQESDKPTFLVDELGTDAFEQIKRTARGTFDIEVTFLVKDENYQGGSYRTNRIYKNVKANDVLWAEKLVEGDFDEQAATIVARINSFKADESAALSAIQSFIEERNAQAEAKCQKNQSISQDMEKTKNKLQSQVNVTVEAEADSDFWSGGEDGSAVKNNKPVEGDFWSSGKDKSSAEIDEGIHVEVVNEDDRVYLTGPDRNIIREFTRDKYYRLYNLDGTKDFFILYANSQGLGFPNLNLRSVIDKNGDILQIDGEEVFAEIVVNKEGGYTLIKYLSDPLYIGELFNRSWNGARVFYESSSEAINDLKTNIEIIEEEQKRESKGGYQIGILNKYNVLQVKEVIADSQMRPLITRTGFKVRRQ